MKILFCAAECYPFVKVGGLGDVVYSLPKALVEKGQECSVIIPLYERIRQDNRDLELIDEFYISLGYRHQYVGVLKKVMDGINFYFIDNRQYFDRNLVYGELDDGERFTFFSKAVIETIVRHFKDYDVLHAHDWQTAMTIPLVREYNINLKTVFTIHNLRFQGIYPFSMVFDMLGLPSYYATEEKMLYFGNANYLKAAIVFADKVTTVSPTYLEEIKLEYYGEGLHGLIKQYEYKMVGILNGIDYDTFNPEKDKFLSFDYSKENIEGKYKNKIAFQKEMDLPQNENIPIIGMVSRLTDQKGLDLVNAVIDEILSMDVQLIVLGTGNKMYEDNFRGKEYAYRNKMRAIIKYDDYFASKVYASSDLYLMPSQFEPCGLSQMIAMRYGSLPVVRETGGLNDTVKAYNMYTKEGNGFTFKNYNAHEMLFTLQKAVGLYYDNKSDFNKMIKSAMNEDFSWDKPGEEYIKLYKGIL
ncbi:glycogen/starch synthase, ADP-glucose type [[Eubacterium] yurii subsp. margaretiae ATCC 43715]|nr:glycogen/starch synthase, ADP-glucose type [[Eubacterium] yurii subsp. margaretiae ATCC 43715]